MSEGTGIGQRTFASGIAGLPLKFRPHEARDMSMQVHVATTGPEPGNWLITVAEGVCRVIPGSVVSPDARLYASSETGAEILSGALSIAEAVTRRLLDYDGDTEALRRFAACFQLGGTT
jgi:hypothetical protein